MTISTSAARLLGACATGCAVAVLAACGSSSPSIPVTSSSGPAATGSGTASAAKPASLAQLRKIVLHRSDLPSGWKATPYHPDPNDSANNAAFARCLGVRNTNSDIVAQAHSADFVLGNADISSSAASYRSRKDINTDIKAVRSGKLSRCFDRMAKKQIAASLPKGTSIGSASIKVRRGSAAGPANIIATGTGTIKIRANGGEVPVYLTVDFITGPLIEAEIDTASVGTPVPASMINQFVPRMAARAANG